MYDGASIFVKEHVSNEEFNGFCQKIGGSEGNRRLDPPNIDQIEFCFNELCQHDTFVVKARTKDLETHLICIDDYAEEQKIIGGPPKTWIELWIASKNPSNEDYLNYYHVCKNIMSNWNCALSSFHDESLDLDAVENRIQEIISC